MLCELHSVYKIIHCIHCVVLHRGSQIIIHYTVKGQFFAFNLEKNYTRQKKFTQTPPVVSMTNMRCAYYLCHILMANGKVQLQEIVLFIKCIIGYKQNQRRNLHCLWKPCEKGNPWAAPDAHFSFKAGEVFANLFFKKESKKWIFIKTHRSRNFHAVTVKVAISFPPLE